MVKKSPLLIVIVNLIALLVFGWFWLFVVAIYLINRKFSLLEKLNLNSHSNILMNLRDKFETVVNQDLVNKIKIKRRFLAIASLAVISTGIAISLTFSFVSNQRANAYINQADSLIAQNKFSEAVAKLDEGLNSYPKLEEKVKKFKVRISDLQRAIDIKKESSDAEIQGNFFESAQTITRITTKEQNFPKLVKDKLIELEPKVEAEISEKIDSLRNNSKYDEALELIRSFNLIYPKNSKFESQLSNLNRLASIQREAEKKSAVSALRQDKDEFKGITWYESRLTPNYRNANAFFIYFGTSNGSKLPLRLVLQYYSSEWLFIESAQVNVDGQISDLNLSNWERDNNSDIWEWSDEPLENRSLIESIIKSKSAVIRLNGRQYYDTRTISQSQKIALKQVLKAYDLL